MKSMSFKKFMSSTTDYRDILHNRAVLYIIFFIALVNVFVLTTLGDWTYVSIFFLVGFLTSFFSKNMVVILFFAINVTNILKYGSASSLEGFDETSAHDEKNKESHSKDEKKGEASADAVSPDASTTYTKEDLEDRKEIMTIQKELLDKMQTMEPFFDKMTKLQEKMTTKKEGMKKASSVAH
jgi:hypothetical protein